MNMNGKRAFPLLRAMLITLLSFSLCSVEACGPTQAPTPIRNLLPNPSASSPTNLVLTPPVSLVVIPSSLPTSSVPNPSSSCIVLGQQSLAPTCGTTINPTPCSPPLPASVITNGTASTVSAQITGYGWPDNSPPGAKIDSPALHQVAGGDGSYCNPTTFATEAANNAKFPSGTMIYVPTVHRYFIREDTCAGCTGIWFDLWVGGDGSNNSAVLGCEGQITGQGVSVTVNPPSTEPVITPPGAVFSNGTCHP